jgi:transcriptional regulator with XRE-family HTH domain
MITNQRQYNITKSQIRNFEQALSAVKRDGPTAGISPRIQQAMGEATRSELKELRRQLAEYEDLRSGKIPSRKLTSLGDLPLALIEARIAANLSQKELAKRLGVAEQQVQRYESSDYAGASLDRVQEIADALGVTVVEEVHYAVAGKKRKRRKVAVKKRSTRKQATGKSSRPVKRAKTETGKGPKKGAKSKQPVGRKPAARSKSRKAAVPG